MPFLIPILSIGTMLISGIFGATQLVSTVKDTTDETSSAALNVGGLLLVGVGVWLVYQTSKKRKA